MFHRMLFYFSLAPPITLHISIYLTSHIPNKFLDLYMGKKNTCVCFVNKVEFCIMYSMLHSCVGECLAGYLFDSFVVLFIDLNISVKCHSITVAHHKECRYARMVFLFLNIRVR